METIPVTVIEVPPFPHLADEIWSEEERHALINYIAYHPWTGKEIPGTGGIRKIRWGRKGMGKRGGVRVIYFFYNEASPIFLLTVYAKGKKENLTSEEKKKLIGFSKNIKAKLKIKEGGYHV